MNVRAVVVTVTLSSLAALLGACASKVTDTSPTSTSSVPVRLTSTAAAATPVTSAPTTTKATARATSATTTAGTTAGATATTTARTSVTTQAPEVAVPGDIPDNQAFVSFAPSGAGYTVKVPEGWARSTDASAVVFTDKFNTIRIESVSMATAPSVASVTAGDLPALAVSTKGYAAGKVSAVTRKAGSAIVATYQGDAPANVVTTKRVRLDVERYVFWKDGKEVIITLSSSVGSDNVDPWKTVTDGFGWVP